MLVGQAGGDGTEFQPETPALHILDVVIRLLIASSCQYGVEIVEAQAGHLRRVSLETGSQIRRLTGNFVGQMGEWTSGW